MGKRRQLIKHFLRTNHLAIKMYHYCRYVTDITATAQLQYTFLKISLITFNISKNIHQGPEK